jgi:signal transduction histidine kinase
MPTGTRFCDHREVREAVSSFSRRPWLYAAVVLIALPFDVGASRTMAHTFGLSPEIALAIALAWAYLIAGLVAWQRRPESRLGPLMVWASFATVWPGYAYGRHVFNVVADALSGIGLAASAQVVLSYTTGRASGRLERQAVEAAYAFVLGLGWLMLGPPVPTPLERVLFLGASATMLGVALLAFRRFGRATKTARRELLPVLVGALSFAMIGTLFVLWALFPNRGRPVWLGLPFTRVLSFSAALAWSRAGAAVAVLVPIAYLWGLLRVRLASAGVADLVSDLGDDLATEHLRDRLAATLGDPHLALLFPAGEGAYVDANGEPVELDHGPHRRGTPVERDGRQMAVLVHDASLDRELVRAAASAVQLALDNERLRAEVRAQLREVRESRQRIVAAADAERRRVERNIHDGAQQRLLTLGLALRRAQRHVEDDRADATRLLKEAAAELDAALQDLRSLAQGIHPAILTDEGLSAAVQALADRCPVPTDLVSSVHERLPVEVETTAYFIASEALTNVVKHSWATSVTISIERSQGVLRVTVEDDGIGGAGACGGTGVAGMRDRVETMEGTLTIHSPRGGGTRVVASMPC